eukprot:9437261-Pyramimonas_sp.AAC.1
MSKRKRSRKLASKMARCLLDASRSSFGCALIYAWGISWGSLGPSWGRLEASEAHRRRKSEKGNNIDLPLPSWRPSWALRGPLGAVLGHLGRPDDPPPSRPGPGEG